MKKLVMLSAIGIMSLSSFGTKEVKKETRVTVKATRYIVYCAGEYTGYFVCDCSSSQVHSIASSMCGY